MSLKQALALSVFGAASFVAASSAHAATNLITDPLFNASPSFVSPGYFPSSSVGGWTSSGAGNSAGIDYFTGVAGAPAGSGNFWDNGNTGSAPTASTAVAFLQDGGAITSNGFALAANTTYTVDFFANSRVGIGTPYSAGNVTVSIGGETLTGASFNPGPVGAFGDATNPFAFESLTFTTTAAVASSALTLTNNNSATDTTTLIDDVFVTPNSVVQSVPEPGSMALLGAGLLGLLFVARRHRA